MSLQIVTSRESLFLVLGGGLTGHAAVLQAREAGAEKSVNAARETAEKALWQVEVEVAT